MLSRTAKTNSESAARPLKKLQLLCVSIKFVRQKKVLCSYFVVKDFKNPQLLCVNMNPEPIRYLFSLSLKVHGALVFMSSGS